MFYMITFYRSLLNYISYLDRRSAIDFNLWAVGVKAHKLGFVYLPEGRALVIKLQNCINNNRYSTNLSDPIVLPTQDEINNVLNRYIKITRSYKRSSSPPLNISTGQSHTTLAQQFFRSKGSRIGFAVRVYEDGIELQHSPFNSYSSAQKFLGSPAFAVRGKGKR